MGGAPGHLMAWPTELTSLIPTPYPTTVLALSPFKALRLAANGTLVPGTLLVMQ